MKTKFGRGRYKLNVDYKLWRRSSFDLDQISLVRKTCTKFQFLTPRTFSFVDLSGEIGLQAMLYMSQAEEDECIWYGQCYTDQKGKIKNCYKKIQAPVLQDTVGLQILNKRCPHLHVDDGEF